MKTKWQALTHPEGLIYYRYDRPHPQPSEPDDGTGARSNLPILTNDVPHALEDKIDRVIADLLEVADKNKVNLQGTEIFLKQPSSPYNEKWPYYIVDHQLRSIFWLHPCDCRPLTQDLGGVNRFENAPSANTHMRTYKYDCMLHWQLNKSFCRQ